MILEEYSETIERISTLSGGSIPYYTTYSFTFKGNLDPLLVVWVIDHISDVTLFTVDHSRGSGRSEVVLETQCKEFATSAQLNWGGAL